MPTAVTRTRHSPGAGTGTGSDAVRMSRVPCSRAASMVEGIVDAGCSDMCPIVVYPGGDASRVADGTS